MCLPHFLWALQLNILLTGPPFHENKYTSMVGKCFTFHLHGLLLMKTDTLKNTIALCGQTSRVNTKYASSDKLLNVPIAWLSLTTLLFFEDLTKNTDKKSQNEVRTPKLPLMWEGCSQGIGVCFWKCLFQKRICEIRQWWWSLSPLHCMPKVFYRVEVRILCRLVKIFHAKLAPPYLYSPYFVHWWAHKVQWNVATNFLYMHTSLGVTLPCMFACNKFCLRIYCACIRPTNAK